MMKNARFALVICFLAVSAAVQAQTIFYLDGYGRTNITNDKMTGEAIDDDTLNTPSKGIGGNTLFDLGINLEKNEKFKANAILRVENQFGLFYGQGTSLGFRQLRLEGVIGAGVKYELGDIDVKMTPYTVFNSDEMFNDFESDIFKTRRDILEYENFNVGNHWRLQGLQSYTNLLFDKGIESLFIKGFAVRTNPTNGLDVADRIMTGWTLMAKQSDILSLGVNYAGMLDLPISIAQENYTNHVVTGQALVELPIGDDMSVGVDVETGTSNYSFTKLALDSTVEASDFFYDADLVFKYNPMAIEFRAGYKDVGPQFYSPAAQTGRLNPDITPDLFGSIPDNNDSVVTDRSQLLYDRFTQEAIYNRSISNTFTAYQSSMTNVSPYGKATPNRKGVKLQLAKGSSDSTLQVFFGLDNFKEAVPDNNAEAELRKFTALRAGLRVDIKQILDWEKELNVTFGWNSENTQRAGTDAIELKSRLIDLGLTAEVFESFDVMVGSKMLKANGNEFLNSYNEFNQLAGLPTELDVDFTENIISFGVRFRFSETAAINVTNNQVSYTNNSFKGNSYNLSQWFLNYTLQF